MQRRQHWALLDISREKMTPEESSVFPAKLFAGMIYVMICCSMESSEYEGSWYWHEIDNCDWRVVREAFRAYTLLQLTLVHSKLTVYVSMVRGQ